MIIFYVVNYRPLSKASEGYVFTGICLFTGGGEAVTPDRGRCNTRGGGCLTPSPPTRTPTRLTRTPPPPEIRSMRGRYASYWNAFLLSECYIMFFSIHCHYCEFRLHHNYPVTSIGITTNPLADLSGSEGCPPPLTGRPNSFDVLQFWGKFDQILCWHPLESWRPHLGKILHPTLRSI